MEFHEKLQILRKAKGLTQEDLAASIYVSRTAVSKWESGRGYPSIDSLKAISKFFGVTIDELLSGDELLTIVQEDNDQKKALFRDFVFGLLDVCPGLLFILPFFGQRDQISVQAVSLLHLTGISSYLRVAYDTVTGGMVLSGILFLCLQTFRKDWWLRGKKWFSLAVNLVGVMLFVISLQPYAAIFLMALLAIKVLVLIKGQ